MDKFEEFIVKKYPSRSAKVLLHKLQDNDGTWFYAVKEVQDQSEAWQSRQAEVDFLSAQLGLKRDQIKGFESEIKKAWQVIEEKDKLIESALAIVSKMAKATNSTAMWAYDLEKALRGEHE